MCAALEVSRSGYYDWLSRKDLPLPNKDIRLRDEIQKIALEFTGYGYRRVTKELRRRGFQVGRRRVQRLMRDDNLLCLRKFKWPKTTDSNHNFPVYPNLAKNLRLTDINQLWVADITYIRLITEFLYLAVIIDVYSRKCVGFHLDDRLDASLTVTALKRALIARWHPGLRGKLVHHSDRGVQYAAWDYTSRLKSLDIAISMSRKGQPWDNPFAESFIKTLKVEEVYMYEYETRTEAYHRIEAFISAVYNQKRLHSSIGYLPPNEFEQQLEHGQH
jgi:transposase InsO family protein